jgi:hypothetical protein
MDAVAGGGKHMSATIITVAEMIEKLRKYPPDMPFVLQCPYFRYDEAYEGLLNGPDEFIVIKAQEVRTGFNPLGVARAEDCETEVLVIR